MTDRRVGQFLNLSWKSCQRPISVLFLLA